MKLSSAPAIRRIASAALLTLVGGVLVAAPSSANVSSASSTTTETATAGETVALAGLSVSADSGGDAVSVVVSTTVGTVSVSVGSSGATVDSGYSYSGSEVAFSGTADAVNTALSTIELTTPASAKDSSASVEIVARNTAGTVYSPETGHFYEFVSSPNISWNGALADAPNHSYGGQTGYLASVPSASVNDLIASKIPGAQNVWLGGQAVNNQGGYPRVWEWAAGPLAGQDFTRCLNNGEGTCAVYASEGLYSNWASGEPNNAGWIEDALVTNWGGSFGQWNDLPKTNPAEGYVVEYGNMAYGNSTPFTGLSSDTSEVALLGVPDAVTDLAATAGDRQSVVSWDAPSNDGGSPITDYTVTVSPDEGDTSDCIGTETSCTITGLTPGTEYTITVVATNDQGDSESSTVTTTPGTAPGVPVGPLDQPLVGETYSDQVTSTGFPAATFEITSGALPEGLELNAETGEITGTPSVAGTFTFQVTASNSYGSAGATFSGTTGQVPSITTTEVGPFTWGDSVDLVLEADGFPTPTWAASAIPAGLTLEADGRLHGTIAAAGELELSVSASNTFGSDSESFTVSVQATPASAPSIASVTPGDGTLSVQVTAPEGDGGSAITSYEYSLDGGVTWVLAQGDVPTDAFEIEGLINDSQYTVQVRAINAEGASMPSEAVSGTPTAAVIEQPPIEVEVTPGEVVEEFTEVIDAQEGTEAALSSTGLDSRSVGIAFALVLAGLGLALYSHRTRRESSMLDL